MWPSACSRVKSQEPSWTQFTETPGEKNWEELGKGRQVLADEARQLPTCLTLPPASQGSPAARGIYLYLLVLPRCYRLLTFSGKGGAPLTAVLHSPDLRFEASQRLSQRLGWTFSLALMSWKSLGVSSSLNQSIFQTFRLFLLRVMGHEHI